MLLAGILWARPAVGDGVLGEAAGRRAHHAVARLEVLDLAADRLDLAGARPCRRRLRAARCCRRSSRHDRPPCSPDSAGSNPTSRTVRRASSERPRPPTTGSPRPTGATRVEHERPDAVCVRTRRRNAPGRCRSSPRPDRRSRAGTASVEHSEVHRRCSRLIVAGRPVRAFKIVGIHAGWCHRTPCRRVLCRRVRVIDRICAGVDRSAVDDISAGLIGLDRGHIRRCRTPAAPAPVTK